MKKFKPLTLLLITTSDSFSPPYSKRQTRLLYPSSQQINSSTRQEIELEERPSSCQEGGSSRRIKKYHAKKIRPFLGLSINELTELTQYYLSAHGGVAAGQTDGLKDDDAVEVSSDQTHEIKRLISSWSKLSSAGYISSKPNGSGDDEALDAVMLTKKEKVLAAEMAERCLRHLIEGRGCDTVSMDLYHSVITAWVKAGSYSDLVHAASLLDYMENNGRNNIPVDRSNSSYITTPKSITKCYVAVLDGWVKSPFEDAAIKAEEVLRRMVSLGIHSVKHYNIVMNRLATNGKTDSAVQAERLLNEMIDMYKSGATIAPDKNSFNTVIKAYAYLGGKYGSRNAKRIFSMMEYPSKYGLQGLDIKPDKVSCTSIMIAWANGDADGACDVDAGRKAEQLLKRMDEAYKINGNEGMRPDTATYNALLKVLGKCGHPQSAQKSEEILDKMLKQIDEGRNIDCMPDGITFNSVIHNIATSPDVDSPQRAKDILAKMNYCHDHGLIHERPDIITYNSVLNSYAQSNSPGSAYQAEKILDNLEKSFDSGAWNIQPDVYSYNTVISAWSNSDDEDSVQRAVSLLDRMLARAEIKKANPKPDTRTYNTVLHAWSQSNDRNAPIKALGLLELMFRYYENGNEDARPDIVSFSTVINAFSKSNYSRKAQECQNLLRRMQKLYDNGQVNMKPNVFVYSAVLNACAYTFGRDEEKEEALTIGLETWEELKSSCRPNHVAYGSFLRICRRLMHEDDPRRTNTITRAFNQCCADGYLGIYMFKQIRADYKLYISLLHDYLVDGEVEFDDLPAEWSRNVRERRKSRQPRKRSFGYR